MAGELTSSRSAQPPRHRSADLQPGHRVEGTAYCRASPGSALRFRLADPPRAGNAGCLLGGDRHPGQEPWLGHRHPRRADRGNWCLLRGSHQRPGRVQPRRRCDGSHVPGRGRAVPGHHLRLPGLLIGGYLAAPGWTRSWPIWRTALSVGQRQAVPGLRSSRPGTHRPPGITARPQPADTAGRSRRCGAAADAAGRGRHWRAGLRRAGQIQASLPLELRGNDSRRVGRSWLRAGLTSTGGTAQ